jgi:3-methyladenine DNA glycosylase AlkD
MPSTILKEIYSRRDEKKAKIFARFFKTKEGYYGAGDIFWGLPVPQARKISEKYKDLSYSEILKLLKNQIHEVRLIGILVLVHRYKRGSLSEKDKVVKFYLKNTKYINNWDLVDSSAYQILGEYLSLKKNRKILLKLAKSKDKSKNLWEKRIAIVSTLAFIRRGELAWTFKIAEVFLDPKYNSKDHPGHDLIDKATGWMLREAGKKDSGALRKFLDIHINNIPRTMLRYAIERFPENIRLKYLLK